MKLFFPIMILTTIFIAIPCIFSGAVVFTNAAFCHPNWLSYESKCYRIFETREDYFTSELFCMLLGGRSASISTQEIHNFLAPKFAPYNRTTYWVGLKARSRTAVWNDGVRPRNESWISPLLLQSINDYCAIFDTTTNNVVRASCESAHSVICVNNKTLFDPIEHCKMGLTTHSFIGEETGRCIYRLPVSTQKSYVDTKCEETGGVFLNLDKIMRDGLNTFNEHKVLTNDGLKYWTGLTWNGSSILWETGEVLEQHFPFVLGTGSCITVSFNFTNLLDTHLFQTECTSQAYVICGAAPNVTSTVPATSATIRPQLFCPQGHNWKQSAITGACYWETSYETNRMSWDDARSYCQGFGGDLASFHSIEEEKIGLSFQYGSLAHPYWIGLKLDPVTETYKWSDGSSLDYENWAPDHPDHKDKRLRCVAMDAKSKHWVSSLCGIISWFVCKAPKRSRVYEPVIPTRPPLVPCGGDLLSHSFYFEGYCYSIINTQYSWHRARQYCENEGSSLVSMHSDQEIGFLLRMLYDNKDTRGNRVWIGLNSLNAGSLRWTDWSPIDFTYWNENEPNNFQNQEKCCNMYIGNGLWNDENCNSQMGFICKQVKDATVVPVVQTTVDPLLGNCKKGWYPYQDRCYLLRGAVENERANWTVASDFCTNQGGYITSIRNEQEQAFLAYLMQNLKEDTWIGFHDTIESGKYYWMDNSDIQYTNWALGEPSFFGLKEDCVKMVYSSLNSGVWEDEVCSIKLPFICQMEKDPNLPKPVYNRGNECLHPEGWLKLGQLCFKMFEGNHMTWEEAETACRRDGAHLISMTGTEIMAVANYLGTEVNQTFWIGLQSNEENKITTWLNGWPVLLTKWGKNEPGTFDKNLCYASTADGYWERFPCTEQMPYICEISTGKPPAIKKYEGNCPKTSKDWISTDGSYCLLKMKTREDWFTAYLKCYAYGSDMVSIHSFEDLKILKSVIDEGVYSIFLGLARNIKGGYLWLDGSPVDYVNWDVGEPENEVDRCVEMIVDTLKWKVVPCSQKRFFVCGSKKDLEIEYIPRNEKLIIDSSNGLSTAALAGISVVCLLVVVVIVGVYSSRNSLGKSRFRIPFMEQSMSFENALYNVDSSSMEFQNSRRQSSSSR